MFVLICQEITNQVSKAVIVSLQINHKPMNSTADTYATTHTSFILLSIVTPVGISSYGAHVLSQLEVTIRTLYRVVRKEFQGLQIGILNHPVTVKITELLTIQWTCLQGDSLNF